MKLAVYKFPGCVSFYQMPYKENKEDYRHHVSVFCSVGTIHQCIDVSRYLSRDSYRDTVCKYRDT